LDWELLPLLQAISSPAQCFERFKTYFQEIGIRKCSSISDPSNRYNNEGIDDKDLVISNLVMQDIQKYRSLFLHVSAAIQLRKYPLKGETIQYIYTDSKRTNPLCRVTSIENFSSLPKYDKEKYKEMILDAAETVLGIFGFDRTVYGIPT
jgi:DNA polymerase elongation subunit (family B)